MLIKQLVPLPKMKMWVEHLRAKMIKYLRNSLLIKYIRDLPQRELLYQGRDVKG